MGDDAENVIWQHKGDVLEVTLKGSLTRECISPVWEDVLSEAARSRKVAVDASELQSCDGSGLALLQILKIRKDAQISGLGDEIGKLLSPFDGLKEAEPQKRPKSSFIVSLGMVTSDFLQDLKESVTFLGETLTALGMCLGRPRLLRWNDLWVICERAGVQAMLITGMIAFLTGMILSFQASAALQNFGVEIFVVNMVAIAMLREMGVIMTAVVLAGRSGSSFAAEIGTMKVNEEIDAMKTMGLDPVRFLVVPRVLAGILIMPVLTLFANALGLLGGLGVMVARGFTWPVLWNQMLGAVGVNDLLSGVIKSFVFGFLIAGIACLRGLQTGSGATAVGISTTRSVVSGIFLIVVADAIFAVVFYVLDF